MSFRISPIWWPVLILAFPFIGPWLFVKNRRFQKNRVRSAKTNNERIIKSTALNLPELDYLDLTVLVDWKTGDGFLGDAAVSYLCKTGLGSMLFDVGFGPDRPALSHNAARLNFNLEQVDALTISHLHSDHMGGLRAQRNRRVTVPEELLTKKVLPCYLPDKAEADGFQTVLVKGPRLLTAGIASTGPLARSLFVFGYTEEQALIARIKGKGLVVITGCGHPTIEVIMDMVKHLSNEPLYAIAGGLHFPVSGGRGNRAGIQFQTLIGTGKPPWKRITEKDLGKTIAAINNITPQKVILSAHDTCDYSLERMKKELNADTDVLRAGETFRF